MALSAEWTDDQQKQFEEFMGQANGDLAASAIDLVDRLRSRLTEGEPKRSFLGDVVIFLLFWSVYPSQETVAAIREELQTIAADLGKVEVQPS